MEGRWCGFGHIGIAQSTVLVRCLCTARGVGTGEVVSAQVILGDVAHPTRDVAVELIRLEVSYLIGVGEREKVD